MKDKDLIITALLCLGLIIIGCGAAYIEGLNPNGGTYYMVRGFVSTEEQVGSSMIIAFMGVVGLLCCIFVKIAESLKNMNSKKNIDRWWGDNCYSNYCSFNFRKFIQLRSLNSK